MPESTPIASRPETPAESLLYALPEKIRRVGKGEAGAVFVRACDLARIEPTRRQWSKWCRSRGLAQRFKADAQRALSQPAEPRS